MTAVTAGHDGTNRTVATEVVPQRGGQSRTCSRQVESIAIETISALDPSGTRRAT
jgi:hypothetical protein